MRVRGQGDLSDSAVANNVSEKVKNSKRNVQRKKSVVDFRKIDAALLPALFNR